MKRNIIGIALLVCFIGGVLIAEHRDKATNVDRVVLGSNNYGTDPNPARDITLANDTYIDGTTTGQMDFNATLVKTSAGLQVGTSAIIPKMTTLDSILSAIVFKSTAKILVSLSVPKIVDLDSLTKAVVMKSTVKVLSDLSVPKIIDLDSLTKALVVKSTLRILGAATLVSDLTVGGNSVLENVTLDSITSAAILKSTLLTIGNATFNGSLEAIGVATLNNVTLDTITSAAILKSTLQVMGAATLNSTLSVEAATTLKNAAIDTITNAYVNKSTTRTLGTATFVDAIQLIPKEPVAADSTFGKLFAGTDNKIYVTIKTVDGTADSTIQAWPHP